MKQQNKWEKLFEEFLEFIEFRLVKYKSSDEEYNPWRWGLIDKQGANLGDIEWDRFANAEGILDRMSIYIEDYYIRTIDEDILEDGQYFDDYEECLGLLSEILADNSIENDFRRTVEYHYDILDMIVNHYDEIKLENIYYEEEQ